MRAFLLEDNPDHKQRIEELISENHPEIEIIAYATSVKESAKMIQSIDVDLLILDVEVIGGTAFDVLERIEAQNYNIIFTTASEEYAIQAFRMAAMDYLLKPIQEGELKEAIGRIKEASEANKVDQLALLRGLMSQKADRIALHTQEEIHILNLSDIIRCEAMGNYCTFHTSNTQKKKVLVTKTLKEYDKMISDKGFLRVHQSHLVNLDHVKSFVKTDGGYLLLSDGSKIPVSTRRRAFVVESLSQI